MGDSLMSPRRRWPWLVLVALSGIVLLFGVGDVFIGVAIDPGIPLGLTGMTLAELEAESPAAYRLIDFLTRSSGVQLVVLGMLLLVLLFVPYRRGERWAWYALWTLLGWAAAGFLLNLAFGVAPGQPPPPPLISAPILAVVAALALLADRSRFYGPSPPTDRR